MFQMTKPAPKTLLPYHKYVYKLKCSNRISVSGMCSHPFKEIICIVFPTCMHLHLFKLDHTEQDFPLSGTLHKTRAKCLMLRMSLDSLFAPPHTKR